MKVKNVFLHKECKCWIVWLTTISRIWLMGIFLLPTSTYSQEIQKSSWEYQLIQLSEEDIRQSLERARSENLAPSEIAEQSLETKKAGWTKSEEIVVRMNKIIVPRVPFGDDFFSPENLEVIRKNCIQVDPWLEQVQFENRLPKVEGAKKKSDSVSSVYSVMKQVPALDVLRIFANLNGANLIISKGTVYFIPKDETIEPITERVFSPIPDEFFGKPPFTSDGNLIDVKANLMDRGVKFWKGTSAVYDRKQNTLKMINTSDQLEYVAGLIRNESKSSH